MAGTDGAHPAFQSQGDPSRPTSAQSFCGGADWFGDQNKAGVDLSLIRENLKLSVDERLAKNERARRAVLALRAEQSIRRTA